MVEYPLFIVDPADKSKRFVGTKQVHDDGSFVWFRQVGTAHVMRIGSFGVDATTYDVQFRGKPGKFKVVRGDITYEVDFRTFEKNATQADYGHGLQYFLAFGFWTTSNRSVSPMREEAGSRPPAERVVTPVWGETMLCSSCRGRGKKGPRPCDLCAGTGLQKR